MKTASGLTDGVVRLRPPEVDDARAIAVACQDAEIQRWTPLPSPYCLEDALKWVALAGGENESRSGCHYVVVGAEEPRLLGAVFLHLTRTTSNERYAKGGYWVVESERGRGVASRALLLVTEWALANLDIAWVELSIDAANQGSIAVAKRAGFQLDEPGVERLGGRMVELDHYRRFAAASSA